MALTVIPVWMKQEVLERDNWTCLACGIPVHLHPDGRSRPNSAHMDHIIPDNATHRGLTEVDNLQTLCRTCNLAKGNRVIDYRPEAAASAQVAASELQAQRQARADYLFAEVHKHVSRKTDGNYVIGAPAAANYNELIAMGYTGALIKQGLDAHSAIKPPPYKSKVQLAGEFTINEVQGWRKRRAERRATTRSGS